MFGLTLDTQLVGFHIKQSKRFAKFNYMCSTHLQNPGSSLAPCCGFMFMTSSILFPCSVRFPPFDTSLPLLLPSYERSVPSKTVGAIGLAMTRHGMIQQSHSKSPQSQPKQGFPFVADFIGLGIEEEGEGGIADLLLFSRTDVS